MMVDIIAPPEVIADLKDGRACSGGIRAYCRVCDPDRRKRDGGTLWAGMFRGRPWWGCHRCHCEKDYAAARKTSRLRLEYDRDKVNADDARKLAYALEIVDAATFIRQGDPVDRYLRETRKLVPQSLLWPTDLRVASRKHSFYPKRSKDEAPQLCIVMIAVVRDAGGNIVACHRTYLYALPDGSIVKLSDERVPREDRRGNAKLSLAPVTNHAIRLGVDTDEIGVAEGIESALGLSNATGLVCWSAISAHGMEKLVVPTHVKRVVIGPDIDEKATGMKTALRLKQRLHDERAIRVDIVPPPPGCNDWGDAAARKR